MRILGEDFAAHLESGATTLAICWRIVRRDGVVLGFTDHDEALSFAGTEYRPAHGLDGGERPEKLGAQVATTDVVGLLHSDAIDADDILLGRYDGAAVETWRVNWQDLGQRLLVSRATIGAITREDGVFRAELRSGQAALNEVRGRLYQGLCDAELGDARCGIDLSAPGRHGEAVVLGVRDRFRLAVEGIEAFDEGVFAFGVATWESGRREGLRDRVRATQRLGGIDILSFAAPVGDWVAEGDALELTVGCDRRFSTCRDRFENATSFRGFPHIPGADYVLRYPREGARLDGRALAK